MGKRRRKKTDGDDISPFSGSRVLFWFFVAFVVVIGIPLSLLIVSDYPGVSARKVVAVGLFIWLPSFLVARALYNPSKRHSSVRIACLLLALATLSTFVFNTYLLLAGYDGLWEGGPVISFLSATVPLVAFGVPMIRCAQRHHGEGG